MLNKSKLRLFFSWTDQRTELQRELGDLKESLASLDKGKKDILDNSKKLKDQLNQAVVSWINVFNGLLVIKKRDVYSYLTQTKANRHTVYYILTLRLN